MFKKVLATLMTLAMMLTVVATFASAASKPTAPTISSFSATSKTITVKWGKVKDADGYCVYRRKNADSDWKKVGTVKGASTVSYKDEDLSGKYQYRVKAYKTVSGSKVYSSASEAAYSRTLKKADMPYVWHDGVQDNVIGVTVSKSSGATGMDIYCREGSEDWAALKTNIKEFDKYGVNSDYGIKDSHNKKYTFKVRGRYKNGGYTTYGPYSDPTDTIQMKHAVKAEMKVSKASKEKKPQFVTITNKGSDTLRVYAKDSMVLCADGTTSPVNYMMTRSDYDKLGTYSKDYSKDYVDIKAGQTMKLVFVTKTGLQFDSTDWALVFYFKYDSIKYFAGVTVDASETFWTEV